MSEPIKLLKFDLAAGQNQSRKLTNPDGRLLQFPQPKAKPGVDMGPRLVLLLQCEAEPDYEDN